MHDLIAIWLRFRDEARLEFAVRTLTGRWRPWVVDGGRGESADSARRFLTHAGLPRSLERWEVLQALLNHLHLHQQDSDFVVKAIEAEIAPWDSPDFGARLREWVDAIENWLPDTRQCREQALDMLAIWASTHIGFDEDTVVGSAFDAQGQAPGEPTPPHPALLVGDAYARFVLRRSLIGVDRLTVFPHELDLAMALACHGISADVVAKCIAPWLLCCWLMGWDDAGRAIVESYGRTIETIPPLMLHDHRRGLDRYGGHAAAQDVHHGPLLGWWLNFTLGDADDERIPEASDACWKLIEIIRATELEASKADDESLWGMSYFALAAVSGFMSRNPVDTAIRNRVVVVADKILERMTTNPHAILRILRDPRLQPPQTTDNFPASAGGATLDSEWQDDANPAAPVSSNPLPFPDSPAVVSGISRALAVAAPPSASELIHSGHALGIDRLEDTAWLSWMPANTVFLGIHDIPLPEDDLVTLCVVALNAGTKGIIWECFSSQLGRKRTGLLSDNVKLARDTAWDQFERTGNVGELAGDLFNPRRVERRMIARLDPLVDSCIAWAAEMAGGLVRLREYDCLFSGRGEVAGVCPAILGSAQPLLDAVRSITCVPSGSHAVAMWAKAMRAPATANSPSIAVIGHERVGNGAHSLAGLGNRHMFERIVQARSTPTSAWSGTRLWTAAQQPLATCARAREATSRSQVALVAGHGASARGRMGVQLADGLFPLPSDPGTPIEIYASCFGLRWGQRGAFADLLSPVLDEFTLSRLCTSSTRTTVVAGFSDKISFAAAGEIGVELAEAMLVPARSPFELARCAAGLLRRQLADYGLTHQNALDRAASMPTREAIRLDALLSLRVAGFTPWNQSI